MAMRTAFIAGNWKMNLDAAGAAALAKGLKESLAGVEGVRLAVAPPFVYLAAVAEALTGSTIAVAAQDAYFEPNGAFTGEVSVAMLADVGCRYVICGHSERRHVIGETDALIARKVRAVLAGGLEPILCIGELLAEREAGRTEEVVKRQLTEDLAGLSADEVLKVTIAYEPVWAIGTGRTATPEQAAEVHAFIRRLLTETCGAEAAEQLVIQYGGSVKPDNTFDLMRDPNVDGALVGGASLKADSFAAIVREGLRAKEV
jgi:triosephosphate isomerase